MAQRFFAEFPYDRAWIADALRGRRYTLHVDCLDQPSAALLQDHRSGFGFVNGEFSDDVFVSGIVERVKDASWPLICSPSESWGRHLIEQLPKSFREIRRVDFQLVHKRSAFVSQWQSQVPKNLSIHPINAEWFEQIGSDIDPDFHIIWTDRQVFLEKGIGFCVVEDGRVVSYATTAFPLADIMATGVATKPSHRSRGLAGLCLAALIEGCAERGIALEFTTGANNVPAQKLARKCGFGDEKMHTWLAVQ